MAQNKSVRRREGGELYFLCWEKKLQSPAVFLLPPYIHHIPRLQPLHCTPRQSGAQPSVVPPSPSQSITHHQQCRNPIMPPYAMLIVVLNVPLVYPRDSAAQSSSSWTSIRRHHYRRCQSPPSRSFRSATPPHRPNGRHVDRHVEGHAAVPHPPFPDPLFPPTPPFIDDPDVPIPRELHHLHFPVFAFIDIKVPPWRETMINRRRRSAVR